MTDADAGGGADRPEAAGPPQYENSNLIPEFKTAARRRLSSHQWLQIEQAAQGCVSGFAYEWPDLRCALIELGIHTAWDCAASTLRTICLVIVTRESLVRCEADPPAPSTPRPGPSELQ